MLTLIPFAVSANQSSLNATALFTAVTGGVVGALLTALLTVHRERRKAQYERRLDAYVRLLDELSALDQTNDRVDVNALNNGPELRAALIRVRTFGSSKLKTYLGPTIATVSDNGISRLPNLRKLSRMIAEELAETSLLYRIKRRYTKIIHRKKQRSSLA